MAALVDALPEEGVRACLDYAFSRLDRPKGKNHKRDKELLRAVAVTARAHPRLKTEALRCICRGVLLGDITGREALGEGLRLLYEDPELSRSLLCGSSGLRSDHLESIAPGCSGTGDRGNTRFGRRTVRHSQERRSPLLRDADSLTCNRLAVTLSRLPAELFRTDLSLLSAHTDRDVRAGSAVIWVRVSHLWPFLGERLASDAEPSVRRALASGLGDEPLHRPVAVRLRADHRRDVRTLLPKAQAL